MNKSSSNDFIATTQKWFNNAPALPPNAKEVLVNITPWVALIFGIIGILGSIAGLGILTALSPFAVMGGVSSYGTGLIAALIWLVSSILLLAAYPGTKARKLSGWNLLYWSRLVNFLGSILTLSIGSIFWGLIGLIISFYLLFQIKSYYK